MARVATALGPVGLDLIKFPPARSLRDEIVSAIEEDLVVERRWEVVRNHVRLSLGLIYSARAASSSGSGSAHANLLAASRPVRGSTGVHPWVQ